MKKLTLFAVATLLSTSLLADVGHARRLVSDAGSRLQSHRETVRSSEDKIKSLQTQLSRMRGDRESFAQKQQELQQAVAQYNALVAQTGSHISQLSQATQSAGHSYRVTGGGHGSWSVEEPNYPVQKAIVYKDDVTTGRSSY